MRCRHLESEDQAASATTTSDLFGMDASPLASANTPFDESPNVAAIKRPVGRPAVNWSTRDKSSQERDLFELSLEIEQRNAQEAGNKGFIATAMIYASLPHSAIEGAFFKRKSNTHTLTILNDPDIGLPYGKLPRVMTAFLCTEAKLRGERKIFLGRSQAEFANKLGLSRGGGQRGDITRLKDQCKRLFTSHINLVGLPNDAFHWRNVNISDKGMLLWNPHDPHDPSPWESWLDLSEPFFNECIDHAVPIEMDIIHQLRSPLAIDIYIWLTYRYNSISRPTPVTWKQLKWQFGANYADTEAGLSAFTYNFKKQLRVVAAAYPAAKFMIDPTRFTLLPSKTHVAPS